MASTERLGLKRVGPGDTDHDTLFTETANRLDGLVLPAVKDRDLTAPPGSPADGDRYIVGASATGAWATHDGEIAHYFGGWLFTTPPDGARVFVEDEHAIVGHDGTSWFTLEALVTIGDDAAISYAAPDSFGAILVATDDVDGVGLVYFETATPSTLKLAGAANTAVSTGALTGTTGVDTNLTISAHTDGKVYIENRLGASVQCRFHFLGHP